MVFFGRTVHFITQKLKSKHLVYLSFLWWEVFLREREKIFFIHSAPRSIFSLVCLPLCEHPTPQWWQVKGNSIWDGNGASRLSSSLISWLESAWLFSLPVFPKRNQIDNNYYLGIYNQSLYVFDLVLQWTISIVI